MPNKHIYQMRFFLLTKNINFNTINYEKAK
jgi:hypothetical protein